MGQILNVEQDGFEQAVLQSKVPVLVDFWAPWCGPCKALEPILKDLAEDYADQALIVKVNADEQRELCEQYQVRGLPTLLIFDNGDIENISKTKTKGQLAKLIDGHLAGSKRDDIFEENLSDSDMRSAFLASGELERVRERLTDDPKLALNPFDDGTTPIAMAIIQGDEDRIQAIMEHGPALTLGNLAALGDIDGLKSKLQQNPDELNAFEGAIGNPLAQSIQCGKLDSAQILLSAGAEVGTVKAHYFSPVNSALRGSIEAFDLLLDNGLDLTDSDNGEILHLAVAFHSDMEIINRLLENNMSPDAANEQGLTALDLAKMFLKEKVTEEDKENQQNLIDRLVAANI